MSYAKLELQKLVPGVIAKPCFYAPVALNHRYRKSVHGPIEVPTTFYLPLRKTFPSLKMSLPMSKMSRIQHGHLSSSVEQAFKGR
ncbi:uncharacterized protein LOC104892402 isoform X5 [Beta vulgaris subsp. vulgaris]|uniref:uncharacterized protein LOC104892402 isoform X5 n=1 Tax=Beta vulgaris subsp. vulgaris TaxID=3555 RepID=UPI0020371B78|nr:uncharacterized protein LOC104892402 isoform X5 [Beta vulgaris subsp. vulgaris]